eukprot:SAG11_NODE_3836_length_2196_cov_1.024797_2_plen_206_part_00
MHPPVVFVPPCACHLRQLYPHSETDYGSFSVAAHAVQAIVAAQHKPRHLTCSIITSPGIRDRIDRPKRLSSAEGQTLKKVDRTRMTVHLLICGALLRRNNCWAACRKIWESRGWITTLKSCFANRVLRASTPSMQLRLELHDNLPVLFVRPLCRTVGSPHQLQLVLQPSSRFLPCLLLSGQFLRQSNVLALAHAHYRSGGAEEDT